MRGNSERSIRTMVIGYALLFVACGGSARAPLSGGVGGSRGSGGTSATDGGASPIGGSGGGAPGTGGTPGTGSGGSVGASTGGSVDAGTGSSVGSGTSGTTGTAGGSGIAGGNVSSPGGAGGVGGDTAAMAIQQCEQLTTGLCTNAATCVTNGLAENCMTQLKLEFGCGRPSPIDFLSCLHETQAAATTCGGLFPEGNLILPSACLPPIQATTLSDAQNKCYDLVDLLCARSITCTGVPATTIDVQDCEDDVTTKWDAAANLFEGIPCLLASSVGPGYAECAAAISTAACVSAGAGGAGGSGSPMSTVPACTNAITFAP